MTEPVAVRHVREGHRGAFVVEQGGERLAELAYSLGGSTAILEHTEVDDVLRGQGVGAKLVEAAVDWARAEGMHLVPLCPFARATFEKRPDLRDVLRG